LLYASASGQKNRVSLCRDYSFANIESTDAGNTGFRMNDLIELKEIIFINAEYEIEWVSNRGYKDR
jgi:hypothetical protein